MKGGRLTLWGVTVSRDRGGQRWRRPRVDGGRGRGELRWSIRIGWRWTAWGLHFSRMEVTREEADAMLAAADRAGEGR